MQCELNLRPPEGAHETEVLSLQVKKSIGFTKQNQLLGLPWHRHALPYAFQGCGCLFRHLPGLANSYYQRIKDGDTTKLGPILKLVTLHACFGPPHA